jgi:hypothetical protein
MSSWAQRPRVIANNLNPALLAAIESASARAHGAGASGRPMPWTMIFLIAPLVLHRPTREALPMTAATHLSTWVARHPLLRAGFPRRASALVPAAQEGLRFGLRHGVLSIDGGGVLNGTVRATDLSDSEDDQLFELIKAAERAGRWLAKTENTSTAFTLLGVAP